MFEPIPVAIILFKHLRWPVQKLAKLQCLRLHLPSLCVVACSHLSYLQLAHVRCVSLCHDGIHLVLGPSHLSHLHGAPCSAEDHLQSTLEFGGMALGAGTWANAYRRSTGQRREALRLLCTLGIITEKDTRKQHPELAGLFKGNP